ncbi:MAG: cell wall hydrolase [Pseudoflavonifractor sp.]
MMKEKLLSGALALALAFTLSGHSTAAECPVIVIDNTPVSMSVAPIVVNRTTYVSYYNVVKALYPDAVATWENDRAVVRASGLTMSIRPGTCYLEANGRYLYFSGGVITENNEICVPVRTLAQALGASVTWDSGTGSVVITSGTGPILPGDQFYNADTLYWLSHIIYAESGNQPLNGKIAVGNVVLNRMASPRFPNNIYDVVFQRNQFTPAMTGSIYASPNAESVLAAKLCMDGANTVGDSLYFVNPHVSPNSWASRNRPHVATIGGHAFFS